MILMLAFGAIGGASGFVMMALLDPNQRSTHLDIWVIAMSAFVAIGFYRLLSRTS
jgi:hypothetical protein